MKELFKSWGRGISVMIIVGWISVLVHEGCHWTICKMLGGNTVIHWHYWFYADTYFLLSKSHLFYSYCEFAGGIGSALFLLPLAIFSFKKKWRWEYRFVIVVVALVQLFYGIAEPFIYP